MSAERALADWLEHGGGLDLLEDDVFEAVVVLRPDLAPAPSLTADDLLAGLDAGPLADPELAALRDMLRPDRAPGPRLVADDILGALTAGPLAAASGAERADAARLRARLEGGQVPAEAVVEEAINVVRPDLALPAATTAQQIVDALAPRLPSVAVAAPDAPRPANRSRAWWWPVVGTLAAAAAVGLVVLQPMRMAEFGAEPASAPAARGIDPALEADMPIAEIAAKPEGTRQAEVEAPNAAAEAAPARTAGSTALEDAPPPEEEVTEDAKKVADGPSNEAQLDAMKDADLAGANAAGGRAFSSAPVVADAPAPEPAVVGGASAAPAKSLQATTVTREAASSGSGGSEGASVELAKEEVERRSKPKATPKAPAQAPAAQAPAPAAGPPPPPAPAADEAESARDADDRLYLEEDVVTRPEGLEQSTSDARADNVALSARVVPFAATKPSTDGLPEAVRAKVVAMWAAADRAAQSPSRAASLLVPLVADPDVPADVAAWTAARAAEYRRIAGDPAGAAALATDALARFPSAGAPRTALWLALGNARLALGDVAGAQAAWAGAG